MLASVAAARRRWMFRDDENTFYMSTPYGAPAPGQFGGPPVYRAPTSASRNPSPATLVTTKPSRINHRQNGSQRTDTRSPANYPPQPWRPGEGPRPKWESLPARPPVDDSSQRQPATRSPLMLDSQTFSGYEDLSTTGASLPMPPPPLVSQDTPPTVHFNRIADIDERECREALLRLVTESVCYGKAPAQQMKITYIKPATALHYVLETFCEARSARYVSQPYRGEAVDGPENGKPPRPWRVACRCDQLFVDRVAEVAVPHTTTIQRCGPCDARGYQRCWRCRGCGQLRCRHCGGDGVIVLRPDAGDNVVSDKCLVCAGNGQKRCVTCEGEGATTCTSCDGYGRLKFFIQLTVTFVTHVDDYVVEEREMPDELMQGVGGMTVFEQNLPQVWPIVTYSNAEINENSQRLVDLHKCAFPNERRLRQRHHLTAVPVTEVHYDWHDSKGRYYVFGQERRVHAPDYPQQCCCGCTVA